MRTKLLLLGAACAFAALIPSTGLPTRNTVVAAPIPRAAATPRAGMGLDSYALASIRPAPVIPDEMLPTILVPFTATLREGTPPS